MVYILIINIFIKKNKLNILLQIYQTSSLLARIIGFLLYLQKSIVTQSYREKNNNFFQYVFVYIIIKDALIYENK